MNNIKIIHGIFFTLLFSPLLHLNGLIIGSVSNISAESNIVFPAADTNNTILGFAACENGFSLENNTTTCTFDAFFPVSDFIKLNAGTLFLEQDLTLSNTVTLATGGFINGQHHALILPHQSPTFLLPAGGSSSSVELQHIDTYQGSKGMLSLAWSPDSSYIATGAYYSSSTELDLFYFDGTTITPTLQFETGKRIYSVDWHPTLDYIAIGCLNSTQEVFIYQFNRTNGSLTLKDSEVRPSNVYTVSWHPSGDYLFVGGVGNPELGVYSFDDVTGQLSLLTTADLPQMLYIDTIRFSPDGNYAVVGIWNNGSTGTYVYEFNGSTLTLKDSVITGYTSSVDWSANNDFIASSCYNNSNRLQLHKYDRIGETLTLQQNESPSETNNMFSLRWHPSLNYLTTSSYSGSTQIKLYSLNPSSGLLTLSQTITTPSHCFGIKWSPNGSYLGAVSTGRHLIVYGISQPATTMHLDNITLVLNSNAALTQPLYLTGNCRINGNGKILYLQDNNGPLIISPDTSVLFENITLDGITNQSLLNRDGSITLRNAHCMLDTDFTFSQGSLLFQEDVILSGTHQFIYSSQQTSSIDAGGTVYLMPGMTLHYAPPSENNALLHFNEQATLFFNDQSSLSSTTTGLHITQGMIVIDGKVTFSNTGQAQSESIIFNNKATIALSGNGLLDCIGNILYL
jgi:6-phosphogluconolactonase (cycloisomerase 2 family)